MTNCVRTSNLPVRGPIAAIPSMAHCLLRAECSDFGRFVILRVLIGGPGRDRTDDLFHAMEARSQTAPQAHWLRGCNSPIFAAQQGFVKRRDARAAAVHSFPR